MYAAGSFPDNMKLLTWHMKKKRSFEKTYGPVNALSNISNIFEKLIPKQIVGYIKFMLLQKRFKVARVVNLKLVFND